MHIWIRKNNLNNSNNKYEENFNNKKTSSKDPINNVALSNDNNINPMSKSNKDLLPKADKSCQFNAQTSFMVNVVFSQSTTGTKNQFRLHLILLLLNF